MHPSATTPVLADAADVLSDQLREHLSRLAVLISPHAAALEKRFRAKLRRFQLDARQTKALVAITPGSIARLLANGASLSDFTEEVEYHGRRLAKLNVLPSTITEALQLYDAILTPMLRKLIPQEYANFQWVREQLQFCVLLTLNNAFYQVREAETEAFYELSRGELEARNLDEVLYNALATLSRFSHAAVGHLYLLDDTGKNWVLRATTENGVRVPTGAQSIPNTPELRSRVAKPRYIVAGGKFLNAVLDAAWPGRYKSFWSVPMAAGKRVAGVIQLGFVGEYEWMPREQELLAGAAERCLMAAEKARLVEDLAAHKDQIRRLAERMLQVEEAERRRISRELHDEAGQSLLWIRLQLEMLEESLPAEQEATKRRLREIRDMTEHAIIEIRRLLGALSPAVLEQIGLAAALRQLVNRLRQFYPCKVRLQLSRLGKLPKELEIIVYRLVQECCNNIAKHSSASNVNISVSSADGIVRLVVEDDGVGFKVDEALARRGAFGLAGIRERVAVLGGSFTVKSVEAGQAGGPGTKTNGKISGRSGTCMRIELPLISVDAAREMLRGLPASVSAGKP